MKRAVTYTRVSTPDQNVETQLLDLRQMAAARGYEIVREYTDKISGSTIFHKSLFLATGGSATFAALDDGGVATLAETDERLGTSAAT